MNVEQALIRRSRFFMFLSVSLAIILQSALGSLLWFICHEGDRIAQKIQPLVVLQLKQPEIVKAAPETSTRPEPEAVQTAPQIPPITEAEVKPEVVEPITHVAETELQLEHKPAIKPVLKPVRMPESVALNGQRPRKIVRVPATKPLVPAVKPQPVNPPIAADNSASSHSAQMTEEKPAVAKDTLNSPTKDSSEAAPEKNELTNAQQNEISRYLARIRAILEKNKKYPRAARRRKIEGQVPVSFAVLADGSLHDPKIAGPVPEELREATLQLLMNLRLPTPPPRWQSQSRIEFTISYRLH